MTGEILAVRADDLRGVVRFERFRALPKEEIERLHAAVHYNYQWLTHRPNDVDGRPSDRRSLLVSGFLRAEKPAPIFLDETMDAAASRVVNERAPIDGPYDLRLAGLLNDDSAQPERGPLGLVYIAKLRQEGNKRRGAKPAGMRIYGSGELQVHVDGFDQRSRILIGFLHAL